ncbi:hypothetical protein GCM10010467_26000 [Actinocorallia glomerata]|uniref:DUF559 domain-containing protein n=2 Tax=Actinomycetes TaxID=1760 RepID=A0ABP6LT13_9MICC
MKTPRPLPPQLRDGVFSRRQAEALGVPPKRLRARDMRRVGRGLYEWVGSADVEPLTAPIPDAGSPEWFRLLKTVQEEYRSTWFSHSTAARIFGLHLPSWADEPGIVHLSRRGHSTGAERVAGLVPHMVVAEEGEVVRHGALWVSRPARIFFDLMGRLPERELVALGDQLVRSPYPELEGRDQPWETRESLADLVAAHRKTKGIVKGRRAVERVRVGADSRPETLLRLAIQDTGLPEPMLQVRPTPGSPYPGDLGYPELKIVIQYDGGTHFSAAQQARDQRRNHAFERAGWTVILANSEDLREGFVRVVERIRLARERSLRGLGPFQA